MKLEVYFIRPGESWANKIQKTYGPIHWCVADPELTPKGVYDSENMKVPDVDVVCCSELLRAKQTAYYAYPGKIVYIVPGTKELGFGLDNMPLKSSLFSARFVTMKHDPHCDSFLDYFKKFKSKGGNTLKIALFTHHRFIAKHTENLHCENNEIVKFEYNII